MSPSISRGSSSSVLSSKINRNYIFLGRVNVLANSRIHFALQQKRPLLHGRRVNLPVLIQLLFPSIVSLEKISESNDESENDFV